MTSLEKYNIDHRVLGAESSLSPFLQHITTQRQAMFASQIKQSIHVNEEVPIITSGSEIMFDKLHLDPTYIEEDSTLIGYIPKVLSNKSSDLTSYTVLYYSNSDRTVKYFEMDSYTLLNRGNDFCYKNIIQNTGMILPGDGSHLPAGTSFVRPPSSKDGLFGLGINAKTIYTSHADLLNDSVIISESCASALTSYGCKEYVISLSESDIPLNVHGSYDDYKILPDIGDPIYDGILFAYRPAEDLTVASDLSMNALRHPNPLHDSIYTCPKNSSIVSIELFVNPKFSKLASIKKDVKLQQFYEIHRMYEVYYKEILKLYELVKERDLNLSPEANSLFTHAMGMTKVDKHSIKDIPVDFIECRIVVVFPREVNPGSKITCRSANKGVIAGNGIWPDECMPITEDGIRADIIVSDNSPFNRLNVAQWYEHFITYASEVIRRRINNGEIGDYDSCFNYMMSLKDIIARNDKITLEQMLSEDPTIKETIIEELRISPMYHCIPPFSKEIGISIFKEIMDKFNISKKNWSFKDPTTGKVHHSKYPTIVGDKYIYLLGNLPEHHIHAAQIGYVNQLGLPMKEGKYTKQRNNHSGTVVKFGVDENCITCALAPTSSVVRWMHINGHSLPAVRELQKRLMTDQFPTRLFRLDMSTQEMLDSSTNISIFRQLFNCIGLDTESKRVHNQLDIKPTTPFNVVKRKTPEVFKPIDDKPYLTNIFTSEGDEITLISIAEFKVIDNLMERDLTHLVFQFSDGSVCHVDYHLAIFNLILWEVFVYFRVPPSKDDIFMVENIKSKTISKIYTKIYYRLFNAFEYTWILERLWVNINFINTFNTIHLPSYNSTLCGIDLADTINHPEMQKLLATIPSNKRAVGLKDFERVLNMLTQEVSNKILDGTIPSELKKFLETDSLKLQQVGQMLLAYGPRDDIDGEIPRYVISNSCLSGLSSVEDFATESLSVKKSMFYNKTSIEKAGAFGKYFRVVGESQISLSPGSCGNTETYKIVLEPHWEKGFLDRVIVEDGQRILLDEKTIKRYLGKEINLVTPINCKRYFGVCEECAGYGAPGVLNKFIIPNSLLGTISTSKANKDIMQFILSSKHLNKTDSLQYNLDPETQRWLVKFEGKLYWEPEVFKLIKDFYIKVPLIKIGPLDDIVLGIQSPDSWSSIDKLELINKDNESITVLKLSDGPMVPFFSKEMLAYIQKVDLTVSEDECLIIPLNRLRSSIPLLKYNLMNQDMRAYVNKATSFFNSQISRKTEKDVLQSAYELIYSKTIIPGFFIDVVVKAYRVLREETNNGLKLRFESTSKLLDKRDVVGKLRHVSIPDWLKKPETYTGEKYPAVSDVFFNF